VLTKKSVCETSGFINAGVFVVRLWFRHYLSAVDASDLSDKMTNRTLRNDLQLLRQKGYIDSSGKGK